MLEWVLQFSIVLAYSSVVFFLGVRAGRGHEASADELVRARDLWTKDLPGPFVTDDGRHLLPCPYCGTRAGHNGNCRLSMMHTGKSVSVEAHYHDVISGGLYEAERCRR